MPSRYNSSRAKCIKCHFCGVFFSPNKFVFHSHRLGDSDKYVQPDAANFNSWRRHTKLLGDPPEVSQCLRCVQVLPPGQTFAQLFFQNRLITAFPLTYVLVHRKSCTHGRTSRPCSTVEPASACWRPRPRPPTPASKNSSRCLNPPRLPPPPRPRLPPPPRLRLPNN